jgi:hypothetical protein
MKDIQKRVDVGPSDLERFICEENIARYRKLLREGKDESQRLTIAKLLSDEEAKLRDKGSMVGRDVNRGLLSAYRSSIIRYQKLLKTHLTEIERDYIKQRLSACDAAVKALSGPEATAS